MEKFIVAMKTTLDSFVIDIVTDEKGKVWVIEVNPFGELAGSCLFDWSKDRWHLCAKTLNDLSFNLRVILDFFCFETANFRTLQNIKG